MTINISKLKRNVDSLTLLTGVTLSVILPGLNFVKNVYVKSFDQYENFTATWVLASVSLLILWIVLKKIDVFPPIWKFISIFIAMLGVYGILYLGQEWLDLMPREELSSNTTFQMIFKISLSTTLFLITQYSFKIQKKIISLQLENEKIKSESLSAQLSQLQSQLDPHFLFNSLSTLRSMIRKNQQDAEEYVVSLADVYRQILSAPHALATLDEELNTLKPYLFLLSHRFGAALQVEIAIDDALRKHKLPFLSLQTLIENCVKHNVISPQQPLQIAIHTRMPGQVVVSNAIQLRFNPEASPRIGLQNLQKRYELYGLSNGCIIENDNVHFTVILQLIK